MLKGAVLLLPDLVVVLLEVLVVGHRAVLLKFFATRKDLLQFDDGNQRYWHRYAHPAIILYLNYLISTLFLDLMPSMNSK